MGGLGILGIPLVEIECKRESRCTQQKRFENSNIFLHLVSSTLGVPMNRLWEKFETIFTLFHLLGYFITLDPLLDMR